MKERMVREKRYSIEGRAAQYESKKESLLVPQSGSGQEPLSEITLESFFDSHQGAHSIQAES
jgi:hypothetical protein